MLTTYTEIARVVVVGVRVQPSLFNGGEQGRRLKRIDRCDIERRILTGGNGYAGFFSRRPSFLRFSDPRRNSISDRVSLRVAIFQLSTR